MVVRRISRLYFKFSNGVPRCRVQREIGQFLNKLGAFIGAHSDNAPGVGAGHIIPKLTERDSLTNV